MTKYTDEEIAFMEEAVVSITTFLTSASCPPDQAFNIMANVLWRLNRKLSTPYPNAALIDRLCYQMYKLDSMMEGTDAVN